MVVAGRKFAELLVEAFAAGVLVSRLTPAVAAPIAERFSDHFQLAVVADHGAALAHRDVVGGVEADGRELAERADRLAVVGAAERVAAVLDQEKVVGFAECADRRQIERVAERVGEHHGPGFRA